MVRPASDMPPGSGNGFQVDTQAVTDFATTMQTGVLGNIAPNGDRLASTFATGAQFVSGNPSVDVQAMIQQYAKCLDAVNAQLYSYEKWAKFLVDVAGEIATNYQNSDALAKATVTNITILFNQAVEVANRPDPGPRGARLE